jgi:putative Ca2+/H+ antiporter (TMEM165/GDT1 family)
METFSSKPVSLPSLPKIGDKTQLLALLLASFVSPGRLFWNGNFVATVANHALATVRWGLGHRLQLGLSEFCLVWGYRSLPWLCGC